MCCAMISLEEATALRDLAVVRRSGLRRCSKSSYGALAWGISLSKDAGAH